jgi:phosphohistidine phosphatase SixA
MLLGHNPGWEGLFEYFSGHYERFPTGACAVFSRKDKLANWLTPKAWAFETLLRPRDLSAA